MRSTFGITVKSALAPSRGLAAERIDFDFRIPVPDRNTLIRPLSKGLLKS